jgi:16S rRNA (guanine527-N7)-methyltransferase
MTAVAEHVDLQRKLADGIDTLGLRLDADRRDELLDYLALLEKWNATYNLTAVRDRGEMVSHHLLDSLAVARHFSADRLLDVGTGPGLPGIPLAVCWPETAVTLIDSNQKKTAFVRHAISALGLANAEVACERIESWHPSMLFDAVISRAFSDLETMVRSALHVLAPDGVLAAMKGVYPVDELDRLPASVKVRDVVKLDVPGLEAERHLIVLERA